MADPISATLLASAAGSSVGLGSLTSLGTFATFGGYALLGGGVVGAYFGSQLLQDKQRTDNQLTIKQSIPPRARCYGRALLAGSYFFCAADATRLVSGFVLCEGPVSAFEEIRFDNDNGAVTFPALTGPSIYPWFENVFYGLQNGADDQGYQQLIANVFPDWWTPDHRLRGLATVTTVCTLPNDPEKNFSKSFPSGAPSILVLVRGAAVYDPRDGSTGWSRNAALVILDYLRHPRGMNLPSSRIDIASFAAFADVCQSTYAFDGTYNLDEAPKDVLGRMLQCCDGEIYPQADGTIGIRGGVWTEPTVTITPDMIVSCEAQRGVDKLAAFNQVKIRITDQTSDYQLTEVQQMDDLAAQAAAGEVLPQQLDLPMVQSYVQARRLARILLAKGNPAWHLTLTTNLKALPALGERIVRVTYPDLGIDTTFFVNRFTINDDGATCALDLGAFTAAAYTFNASDPGDAGTPPVPPTKPPAVTPPAAPAGLVLVTVQATLGAGSKVGSIRATVTPPTDRSLSLVAQYRALGDTDWTDMSADNTTYTALSKYLKDGTYEVRAAFKRFGGQLGAYAGPSQIAFSSGALGPVASALAAGSSLDYGLASQTISTADDFGLASDSSVQVIDLGLASA